MVSEKESILLNYLRNDSRKSLSEISKETDIPVSTLFCVLRRLESSIIKKHASLLDFPKLGYNLRMHFALSAKQKDKLKEFLMSHKSVNSLHSLTNEFNFYADCVFKDWKDLADFKERLEPFEISRMNEILIVDELRKEDFSGWR